MITIINLPQAEPVFCSEVGFWVLSGGNVRLPAYLTPTNSGQLSLEPW